MNYKDNSGAFFKNDKKRNDRDPDYRGQSTINGVEYWVSVWLATSKKGDRYFSASYTLKDEQRPAQSAPAQDNDPFDDDLPF